MVSTALVRLSPLALGFLLAGCAHYEAKPLAPAQLLQQIEHRRLTDADVVARVRLATASTPEGVADTAPITWGRAQLLVAALQLSPSLAEARAQLAQVAATQGTARAIQNPTVSLATEYDLSRAGEPPWLYGIGTSFLLDAFLARRQRIDLAQASLRGARADFSEAVWTVRRDLRAALLGVVIPESRVHALELDVQQRVQLASLAQARVAAGESARSDSLQAQLELSRSQVALDEARRLLAEGQGKLAAVLGVSAEAVKGIAPRWEDLEDLRFPSEPALQALREQALLARPDLERAIADYVAKELELRQQTRSQYLQASLGPGYTYDHGVRKVTLGASIAVPVFNHNEGPIAEAAAAREAAGRHAITVQAAILSEIDSAMAAYASSLAALERVRSQRITNEALATSARRALDADASDRPTWLAAELAVSTERVAEVDALERAQQALGQLEDAVRTPLFGPETTLHLLDVQSLSKAETP